MLLSQDQEKEFRGYLGQIGTSWISHRKKIVKTKYVSCGEESEEWWKQKSWGRMELWIFWRVHHWRKWL